MASLQASVNTENPLAHLIFQPKNEGNKDFINSKLAIFDSRKDIACEWCDAMIADENNLYFYLYDTIGNLYGAISNDTPKRVNGIVMYYSLNSCTFDRLTILGHPELSSGRVLRAFQLYTLCLRLRGERYVYSGLVIPTALQYNRAMGLVPFNATGIPISEELLDFYKEILHDDSFDADRLTFNPDHSNMLFFDMDRTKLQGKRLTPYNIIQYMLPKSKKLTGASKNRNKMRNKKRKSKKIFS